MADPFRSVPLGRTSLEVTQFGLGTAALSWMYERTPRDAALATLRRAHELGVRFFDTSPLYGSGVSEARTGAVLQRLPRSSFVLSDKVGYAIYADTPLPNGTQPDPPPSPPQDWSYDGALRLVEGSLQRLGLDHIDIMLIHGPERRDRGGAGGHVPRAASFARRGRDWGDRGGHELQPFAGLAGA